MSTTISSTADDGGGFYIAAFAIDGQQEGVGRWPFAKLSPKWMDICRDLLAAQGPLFDYTWSGPLSHIRTTFTSMNGVAISTFYVRGEVATALFVASGTAPTVEAEVLTDFVQSLRNSLKAFATTAEPFSDAFAIADRPLMLPVPFAGETLSDQDHDLVRELSLHLAGAYLLDPAGS